MNTKYIIANIKIPVMLNDDGTYVVLSEKTEINFSNFEGELQKNEKNSVSEEFSNLMSSLLSSGDKLTSCSDFASQNNPTASRLGDDSVSEVLKEVIENVSSIIRKNITFKRSSKKKATSKHSVKNIPNVM